MTDLREPNTPETRPSGASSSATADADPLHNLYRMSRTAGLGSGDYVAINNTSILALILGMLSLLSLLYPLLVVIAIAAIVCGVMALVQIQSSNGTQTGRLFAVVGLLLGLGLGGTTAAKIVIADSQKRRDEAAIGNLIKELNTLIVAKNYGDAYQKLFTTNFKNEFSEKAFAQTWEAMLPYYGDVKSIGWGGHAEFDVNRGTNEKRGYANSEVRFSKFGEPARQPAQFLQQPDGSWQIDGIQQLFEKPKAKAPAPVMPDPSKPLGPDFLADPLAPAPPTSTPPQ